jgi:nitronate monooxygenase
MAEAGLRTPLCDLLGIRYPILQAGMAGASSPQLVAAVAEAGGLGILGGAHMAPEDLRRWIREVRDHTDRPFGVNLLLHSEVWPPIDAAQLPEAAVRGAQEALNVFRGRLGLPPCWDRPESRPDHVDGSIEVVLEEGVRVFSTGMGVPPPVLVRRLRERHTIVMTMVATAADARAAAAASVDVIVAQGAEAGGHVSTGDKRPTAEHARVGLLALLPEVLEAVDLPVVAAGGIATGAGVAASLALGAQGALVGTRFVATREAPVPDFTKRAMLAADGDATVVTDAFTGLYARVLRNTFQREYAASGAPTLSGYLQASLARDIVAAAARAEDAEYFPIFAGQGVGAIRDLPGAADIVARLARDAGAALQALGRGEGRGARDAGGE